MSRAVATGLLLTVTALSACVTEGPPERRPIRPLPEQPAGLVVNRVVPAIDKLADDTDRNGYYDTFRVAIFLFAPGYSQSIQGDGALEFILTDAVSGKELGKWTRSDADLKAAWGMSGVMPGYNFILSLNDARPAGDRVEAMEGHFLCRFIPSNGGESVASLSRLVVMVGPLR